MLSPRPLLFRSIFRDSSHLIPKHNTRATFFSTYPKLLRPDDTMASERPTGLKATSGIELLTFPTPNGQKASIILEELKAAYGKVRNHVTPPLAHHLLTTKYRSTQYKQSTSAKTFKRSHGLRNSDPTVAFPSSWTTTRAVSPFKRVLVGNPTSMEEHMWLMEFQLFLPT